MTAAAVRRMFHFMAVTSWALDAGLCQAVPLRRVPAS